MSASRFPAVRKLMPWLERVREPVFALDARHRLIFVNRAWEELTGLAAAEVLGRECRPPGVVREGSVEVCLDSFAPPPEAGADHPAGGPGLIVRPDGERLWRRLDFWPLRDREIDRVAVLLGFVRERDAVPLAPESAVRKLRAELDELRADLRRRHAASECLLGRGPAHRRLLDQLSVAAASDAPVLILGEPGTGRRTVARAIHLRGRHPTAPFVPIDCAALPSDLIEAQVFGKRGEESPNGERLAIAEGGALVLIDAWELPRDLQVRLAAASEPSRRVLAVASIDPDEARRRDQLHPTLYYQMTTLVIRLVALRERLDDLPILAQHFLERLNDRSERRRAGFAPEALETLAAYDWPGNLRELARVVELAHAHAAGEMIGVGDLPAAMRGNLGAAYAPPAMPPPVTPLDPTLTRVERQLIEKALAHARQNKSRAAELLDISRPRLYRRMKELNIPDMPETAAVDPVVAGL